MASTFVSLGIAVSSQGELLINNLIDASIGREVDVTTDS